MLRQAALTRMYVKKSSGVSMSEVGVLHSAHLVSPFIQVLVIEPQNEDGTWPRQTSQSK